MSNHNQDCASKELLSVFLYKRIKKNSVITDRLLVQMIYNASVEDKVQGIRTRIIKDVLYDSATLLVIKVRQQYFRKYW